VKLMRVSCNKGEDLLELEEMQARTRCLNDRRHTAPHMSPSYLLIRMHSISKICAYAGLWKRTADRVSLQHSCRRRTRLKYLVGEQQNSSRFVTRCSAGCGVAGRWNV